MNTAIVFCLSLAVLLLAVSAANPSCIEEVKNSGERPCLAKYVASNGNKRYCCAADDRYPGATIDPHTQVFSCECLTESDFCAAFPLKCPIY